VYSWFCAAEAADIRFRQLIASRFALIETSPEATRPVLDGGPGVRWPPQGLELEAHAIRHAGIPMVLYRLVVALKNALS
jgi:hypothetical protein